MKTVKREGIMMRQDISLLTERQSLCQCVFQSSGCLLGLKNNIHNRNWERERLSHLP